MIIDKTILDNIMEQAKENPRLRTNLDLRTSAEDGSQRMLNAMSPVLSHNYFRLLKFYYVIEDFAQIRVQVSSYVHKFVNKHYF